MQLLCKPEKCSGEVIEHRKDMPSSATSTIGLRDLISVPSFSVKIQSVTTLVVGEIASICSLTGGWPLSVVQLSLSSSLGVALNVPLGEHIGKVASGKYSTDRVTVSEANVTSPPPFNARA